MKYGYTMSRVELYTGNRAWMCKYESYAFRVDPQVDSRV